MWLPNANTGIIEFKYFFADSTFSLKKSLAFAPPAANFRAVIK
jgi:hypothetical protein